jgi:hypothetical protein
MPSRFRAFFAVSALLCQIGAKAFFTSLWSSSSIGYASELWKNVQLKGGEPSSSLPVALELRLTRLEGFHRDGGQGVVGLLSLTALPLALLDRILALPGDSAPLCGRLACFLEGDVSQGAETHLSPAPVDGHAQEPLRTSILALV